MKDLLFKKLHFLILIFASWQCYVLYTDHVDQKEILEQQVPPVEVQLEKLKKKVANIKKNQEQLKEYESKLEEVRAQVNQLKTKMPSEAERSDVLQELKNQAEELGLKEVTFNPLPQQDRGMYLINSISISGKGLFVQFLVLFEKIQASARFFNVDNLTLTQSVSDASGRFVYITVKADIQTFEYNEKYIDAVSTSVKSGGK